MAPKARPKGSKKMPSKPPVNQVEASRCASCGSTEREEYYGKTEQQFDGVDSSGNSYTHIVRRRTRCKSCGQTRIDRAYENRIGQES